MAPRAGRPRRAMGAALALVLSLGGCGYAVTAGLRLEGGVRRATVRPFENRSSDPEVGVAVATELRQELARRGAEGEGAVIDGEVRTEGLAATLAGGATARVAIEARARLTVDGRLVAERKVRREADHLAGADPIEGEARRAQALQRLAGEVARALVDAFEE